MLTPDDFQQFEENGYVILKDVATAEQAETLKQRVVDLMEGRVRYDGMFFQSESNRAVTTYSGPSDDYRKIKDLEYDPLFLEFMQNATFRQIAERYIGPNVSSMRAMVMNKPPLCPARVPFHQDISDAWQMSGPSVLTSWTALDEATIANGCLAVVPRSHRLGKVGQGHEVDDAALEAIVREAPLDYIELRPGQSVVFFNTLIHGSGPNTVPRSRIAFTLCLMDASVVHLKTGRPYPVMFGAEASMRQSVKAIPTSGPCSGRTRE